MGYLLALLGACLAAGLAAGAVPSPRSEAASTPPSGPALAVTAALNNNKVLTSTSGQQPSPASSATTSPNEERNDIPSVTTVSGDEQPTEEEAIGNTTAGVVSTVSFSSSTSPTSTAAKDPCVPEQVATVATSAPEEAVSVSAVEGLEVFPSTVASEEDVNATASASGTQGSFPAEAAVNATSTLGPTRLPIIEAVTVAVIPITTTKASRTTTTPTAASPSPSVPTTRRPSTPQLFPNLQLPETVVDQFGEWKRCPLVDVRTVRACRDARRFGYRLTFESSTPTTIADMVATTAAMPSSPATEVVSRTESGVTSERGNKASAEHNSASTASTKAKIEPSSRATATITKKDLPSSTPRPPVVRTSPLVTESATTPPLAESGNKDSEDDEDPLEDGADVHVDVLEEEDDGEALMADQPVMYPAMRDETHFPGDLDHKLDALSCVVPPLPSQSTLWRGNQTHELELPITVPSDCSEPDCPAPALGWSARASLQSGDVLLVRIHNQLLLDEAAVRGAPPGTSALSPAHHQPVQPQPAVYGVPEEALSSCDVSQGLLLDITPLLVDGKLLLALYDKDLSDGDNYIVIQSERWPTDRCVKLQVSIKSDNCGEEQDCSGKGVCYSRDSMDGYECKCCPGFMGQHCEERDACHPGPCRNNGICLDLRQGHDSAVYQCLCPYGFTGPTCEEESDPCDSTPCHNGGSCVRNGSQWRCACGAQWLGPQCERSADPCRPSPCKHGICVAKEGMPTCFCQPGFGGEHCDYDYNECESSPCANNGSCSDLVGGFRCTCGPGYRGDRCEMKVDLCHSEPCRSGLICLDLGNRYVCECPKGSSAPGCRPPVIKPACASSPCRHGGTCYHSDHGFYCACRPGYTGPVCNEEAILEEIPGGVPSISTTPRDLQLHLHSMYVGAATLACALLIVVFTVLACHCRVHETYKRCLVVPCGLGLGLRGLRGLDSRAVDPLAALQSKCSRGQPLLDTVKELPSAAASPTSKTAPLLESSDVYYALDFSDSQCSPLIR